MKPKIITILVLSAMLTLLFSGIVMAATYIPGPIDGSGPGGTCPQDSPWTKINSSSGSESGAWGSFSYSGNTLTYNVNQYYTLYLCIKYASTNDGWIIEGPENDSVTTQTSQEISHLSWYFVYDPPTSTPTEPTPTQPTPTQPTPTQPTPTQPTPTQPTPTQPTPVTQSTPAPVIAPATGSPTGPGILIAAASSVLGLSGISLGVWLKRRKM